MKTFNETTRETEKRKEGSFRTSFQLLMTDDRGQGKQRSRAIFKKRAK